VDIADAQTEMPGKVARRKSGFAVGTGNDVLARFKGMTIVR
jgi:hypothetical protein